MPELARRAKRVLIRTQPLGHNYGGLLQAFALQQTLQGLGYDVDTDVSQVPTLASVLGRPYLALKGRFFRRPFLMREIRDLVNSELHSFVQSHLSTTELYFVSRKPRQRLVERYGAFVVGSDQVWRPKYGDVASSLFDFLPENFPGRRFSYAASFGKDDTSEFSPELIGVTRPLAQRLDAVSVREESGVAQVQELWHRSDAQVHVDPTLLLEAADYERLLGGEPCRPSQEEIVSYVLDKSEGKAEAASTFGARLALPVRPLMRPSPTSVSAYIADPSAYRRLSVPAWLDGIRNARFVVTDSFHGCIFSILFHKPFAVIPNRERGLARFESLLAKFGLERRMMDASSATQSGSRVDELIADSIDWNIVDHIRTSERDRALLYLRKQL